MKSFSCSLLILLCPLLFANSAELVVGVANPSPGSEGKDPPGALNEPFHVAFDADGGMIIVEYHGARIHRFADGKLTHVAGTGKRGFGGDGGPALQASFKDMHNVAIDAQGRCLLSDHLNTRIRVYDPKTQTVDTYSGGKSGFAGDGGPIAKALYAQVICVTFNGARDKLLVADIKNRRIRLLDLKADTVTTIAGNGKRGVPKDGALATESPLIDPRAADFAPDGSVYFLERGGHALRHIDKQGRITTLAGGHKSKKDGEALKAGMNGPKHLDVGPDGLVYIADDVNNLIRVYDPKAKTLTAIMGDGVAGVHLRRPHGVTVHEGYLYVADSYNHRILRIKI